MKTITVKPSSCVLVRMSNGEDILECLEQAVRAQGVRNGIITGGVGSVTSYQGSRPPTSRRATFSGRRRGRSTWCPSAASS